jgi:hypothetical protein
MKENLGFSHHPLQLRKCLKRLSSWAWWWALIGVEALGVYMSIWENLFSRGRTGVMSGFWWDSDIWTTNVSSMLPKDVYNLYGCWPCRHIQLSWTVVAPPKTWGLQTIWILQVNILDSWNKAWWVHCNSIGRLYRHAPGINTPYQGPSRLGEYWYQYWGLTSTNTPATL